MTEQAIFLAALEIADPTDRAAYLDAACAGNAALRQQVLKLLAAHESSGEFMDIPAIEQVAGGGARSEDGTLSLHAPAGKARGGAATDDIALEFLQPSAKPSSLGRLGHYEVLEVLGHGGFGVVLKAFDEVLHRVVAIKVLAPQLAATSPPRKRFLREARSAARIRHESVVTIHAVEEQPIPHLVMEFIPGQTLQEKLDETGPLDVPEVVRIGQQIANGLAAAHEMGLIHRDIKPSNILLERAIEQRAKITDFGLARTADDASLTQSGIIAGTPMYMAPEQANGEVIDQRADLFSLGSVLYVMCTGRPPFRASTTMGVLKRVTEDTPRPIREIIPEVPEWLCALIAKLHAKQPAERFQTAKEVADLLARPQSDLKHRVCAQTIANLRQTLPSARLSEQAGSDSGKFATTAEQEVRQQRQALALAVNDHDLESIKRFVHPSYIGKGKNGYASGYQEMIGLAERLCEANSDFQEVVQIESLIVDGDMARLTVRRSCSMTYLQWIKHRATMRAVETWRKFDGRWQLIEEQELERLSAYLGPDEQTTRWLTIAGIAAAAACALVALVVVAGGYLGLFGGIIPGTPASRMAGRNPGPPEYEVVPPLEPAQAKARQEAEAKLLGVPVEGTNSIGMKLALIPRGKFLMGSPDGEAGRDVNEGPQHEVVITQPYYVGVTAVTVGQFKAFVRENGKEGGYRTEAERSGGALVPDKNRIWVMRPQVNWQNPGYVQSDDYPVVCVSYNDAKEFCAWLSRREGRQYDLPTEAQWEYSCRAGSSTRYSFGNEDGGLDQYAWTYHDIAELNPQPVGKKRPNPWGLCDMHGNVRQWTSDSFKDYSGDKPGRDRVLRGGSWTSGWMANVSECRSAHREGKAPSSQDTSTGFRVVLLADQDKVHFSSVPPKSVLAAVAPFVVVGTKGKPDRACLSLQNAVDNAASGDTIEIRGDGPTPVQIATAPAVIDKPLTLRAGAGQRTILVHKTAGSLLRATAPLTLEGLEFYGDQHHEEGESLIEVTGAPLRIAHCRIMVRSKNAIWAHASPLLEMQDSEVIARNWGAINWDVTDKGKLVVKNCAIVAWGAVWLHQYSPPQNAEVELTGNSIFASCFCGHRCYKDPVGAGLEKDIPRVQIMATRNVARCAQHLCLLEYGDKDRPFRRDPLADWYRDHVAWKGMDNLSSVQEGGKFLTIRPFDLAKGEAWSWSTLKDCKDFWNSDKVPWIEGTPRFAGGDLLQRVLWQDMDNITPAEFRLEAGSPGKDLGADVARVGPGAAYVSWTATPEYQEWRKKTEDLGGRP
jgi:formylglycine-generating enzyme required for sulfatase activity/serine/threonine protein kinase